MGSRNHVIVLSLTGLVTVYLLLQNLTSLVTENKVGKRSIWKKAKLISDENYHTVNVRGHNICNINLTNVGLLDMYSPKKRYHLNKTGVFNCIVTRTIPSFKICIYPLERDIYISGSLMNQGIWDRGQTNLIQKALRNFPEAIFIDIGANIGYFSLLARAMDRAVIAIEPMDENFLQLEESIARNNFVDDILLLRHAVTDRRTSVIMSHSEQNQGGVWIIKEGDHDLISRNKLTSVTMNDLSHILLTNEAVIKMDIEGQECKALKTSNEFFKHVQVRYLFMEWFIMAEWRNRSSTACTTENILKTLQNMVNLGFYPYSQVTGEKLDITNCWAWKSNDIFWAPHDSPELFKD